VRRGSTQKEALRKVVNSAYSTNRKIENLPQASSNGFLKPFKNKNDAQKTSYFKLPLNSDSQKFKKFVTNSNCKSKVDLHKNIEIVPKKAIKKKIKKGKKLK
jgi:hypothetical protein